MSSKYFCIYCKDYVLKDGFDKHMETHNRGETEPLYHDEQTLFKVAEALIKVGVTNTQASDAINEMLNAGILFRERKAYSVPYVLPHCRACGPGAHPHGTDCHVNCPTCEGKPHFEQAARGDDQEGAR